MIHLYSTLSLPLSPLSSFAMSSVLLRSLSHIAVLSPCAAPQLLPLLLLRRPPRHLRKQPTTFIVMAAGTSSSSSSSSTTTQPCHTNRLASEHSPYLLQHAHNPVDWYPWGEEAFQEARRRDVPIFLSIGYSTCHWCHVMEVESFENEEVAELLNKWFVSIKVDREERPDIDKVYMTYVSALYGGGGWPLSVFLSPSLKPLMGGTYFPPDDKYGRPGFKTVLRKVKEAWASKKKMLEEGGSAAIEQLSEALSATAKTNKISDKTAQDSLTQCSEQLADSYDPKFGGFGSAPKFPRPVEVCLLLYHSKKLTEMKAQSEANAITKKVFHTLQCMARGGIHDHLGGGFHRYSVDECWHVPHFEKMLYDQGQIANVYLDTFTITRDTFYSYVARDILEYLRREMIGKAGEIFSAEDADSAEHQSSVRKKEGAFYVWTREEIEEVLGDRAELFGDHYYVKLSGNCDLSRRSDPHDEFKRKIVLIERALIEGKDIEFMAEKWGKSVDEYLQILGECRKKLFDMRSTRPRPHLDDKVIVSWNGLAISSFARASRILKAEPTGTMNYFPVVECNPCEYLEVAEKSAYFIRNKLYDQTTYRLKHSYRNGPSKAPGFLDDYAFLISGLLDLYECGGCTDWLTWAIELQATQDELFLDKEGGGYFNTPGEDPSVLLRVKEDHDGAEPSGNSVAAINLIRLSSMVAGPRSDDYMRTAEHLLAVFEPRLKEQSIAVPLMCCAADMARYPSRKQVVVVGDKSSAEFTDMVTAAFASYDPNRTIFQLDPNNAEDLDFWQKHNENISQMARGHGKDMLAVAHVCQDFVCSPPVSTAAALRTLLDKSIASTSS